MPKQLRFCRNYVEIMPSVAEGIKISIQECQHQFRGRRWNCTTINNSLAIFGPVLDKGTWGTVVAFRQVHAAPLRWREPFCWIASVSPLSSAWEPQLPQAGGAVQTSPSWGTPG